MTTVALIGATGMVGSQILHSLCATSPPPAVNLLARRTHPAITAQEDNVNASIDPDTTRWASHIQAIKPPPEIFFSSFATTRAAVGGFEAQYKIEHDLHLSLARAARDAGSTVCVLISGQAANSKSMFGYVKMKGEIEEGIKAMGFEHTVIIRPGLIAGTREQSRPSEAVLRKVAAVAGQIHSGLLKDGWAQEAEDIGRAAVKAGFLALEGKAPEKDWLIAGRDIVRLSRDDSHN